VSGACLDLAYTPNSQLLLLLRSIILRYKTFRPLTPDLLFLTGESL
jgi:hypothetical protein